VFYFSTLFGFCWFIQQGFVHCWQDQHIFWTTVTDLCPDVDDGTVIIIDGYWPANNDFILTSSWADYKVWDELFRWPASMKHPPELIDNPVEPNWRELVSVRNGEMVWDPGLYIPIRDPVVLRQGKVILLQYRDWKLSRVEGTVDVNGQSLRLKPAGSSQLSNAAKRPLFGMLLGSP
jgi:hypothetical protein